MMKPTNNVKGGKGKLTRLQPREGMEYADSLPMISELRESEERFRHAFDFAGTGMGILSTDGRWLRANHVICDMLGYTEEELRQTTYQELTHPEDLLHGREEARQVLAGEIAYMQVEKRYRHRDGHYLWTKLTTSVVRSEHDEPLYFISQIEKIDQRKHAEQAQRQAEAALREQEAQIQYLAYHDALTGLPNRASVINRLDHAIVQAHRHQEMLGVLFLDLDRFKTINDTLGHPAGDLLLQQTGDCLAQTLREGDTIGRFGGDEFLILLPHLAVPEDAAHVANRILSSLSSPFGVASHELHVRASIGISIYPRDADNTETLVKYADTALYLAKEQGRNTFRFFSPELDISGRARLHLENDLRSAVDKNQLYLLYQPLMDVDSGQYIGAEALLRWQHPELGQVSPDDFIPIAEETGLIISIGEWVLRSACLQACTWRDEGRDNFRVSVNLSRRQLEKSDLTATLRKILDETGCPPRLLELEITESSTMSEPEQAIVRLQALKEMGIGLALDDYGTGYSSLAYLKRFPLDRLKIDRSFVAGIPEDDDDMAIVQTTIVLARQLRLKVVAEGVETQAQRSLLESLGCDEIQGYLVGRPSAPLDLASL